MAWLIVIVAGIFEMGFAVLLKLSHGLTRIWRRPGSRIGPAYAVWTGIGAAGTAIVGMAALHESVSPLKLISIALILVGVIGLNFSGVTARGLKGFPTGMGPSSLSTDATRGRN
jgi:quaternary ammonium compound-resistance protein SugE